MGGLTGTGSGVTAASLPVRPVQMKCDLKIFQHFQGVGS